VHVRVTSPEEQLAYLAQLADIAAVKATVSLTGVVRTDNERKLYEALGGLNDVDSRVISVAEADGVVGLGSAEPIHSGVAPLDDNISAEDQSPRNSSAHSNTLVEASPPLVVILLSCVVALVAFLGISLALYIVAVLRSRAVESQNAWEMVPRVENQTIEQNGCDDDLSGEPSHVLSDSKPQHLGVLESLLFDADTSSSDSQHPLMYDELDKDIDTPDLITFDDPPAVDDNQSDEEEPEDFYDTYSDPLTPVLDLGPEITFSRPSEDHSDPPVPSLVVAPQLSSTPIPRSPARRPQMRELNSSPISRPAWSLRAAEDTSLCLPSPSASSRSLSPPSPVQPLPLSPSNDTLSIAVPVPRRRGYRSAIPEFDIALAMQLRPGLGIGADPAWMVRFLMAMFGWFTVLLTGKKDRQQRLAA
jgi:hypothetical protein